MFNEIASHEILKMVKLFLQKDRKQNTFIEFNINKFIKNKFDFEIDSGYVCNVHCFIIISIILLIYWIPL